MGNKGKLTQTANQNKKEPYKVMSTAQAWIGNSPQPSFLDACFSGRIYHETRRSSNRSGLFQGLRHFLKS